MKYKLTPVYLIVCLQTSVAHIFWDSGTDDRGVNGKRADFVRSISVRNGVLVLGWKIGVPTNTKTCICHGAANAFGNTTHKQCDWNQVVDGNNGICDLSLFSSCEGVPLYGIYCTQLVLSTDSTKIDLYSDYKNHEKYMVCSVAMRSSHCEACSANESSCHIFNPTIAHYSFEVRNTTSALEISWKKGDEWRGRGGNGVEKMYITKCDIIDGCPYTCVKNSTTQQNLSFSLKARDGHQYHQIIQLTQSPTSRHILLEAEQANVNIQTPHPPCRVTWQRSPIGGMFIEWEPSISRTISGYQLRICNQRCTSQNYSRLPKAQLVHFFPDARPFTWYRIEISAYTQSGVKDIFEGYISKQVKGPGFFMDLLVSVMILINSVLLDGPLGFFTFFFFLTTIVLLIMFRKPKTKQENTIHLK